MRFTNTALCNRRTLTIPIFRQVRYYNMQKGKRIWNHPTWGVSLFTAFHTAPPVSCFLSNINIETRSGMSNVILISKWVYASNNFINESTGSKKAAEYSAIWLLKRYICVWSFIRQKCYWLDNLWLSIHSPVFLFSHKIKCCVSRTVQKHHFCTPFCMAHLCMYWFFQYTNKDR